MWDSIEEAKKYINSEKKYWYNPQKREDITEAIFYCADNGDVNSQYLLYSIYYKKADYKSAFLWCVKAAENGNIQAQYDLGLHYLYGDIIDKDITKALSLLEQSAENGYQEANKKLVNLYRANTIIRINEQRAKYWADRLSGYTVEEIGRPLLLEEWMVQPPETLTKKAKVKVSEKTVQADKESTTIGRTFTPVEQDYVINGDINKSFVVNAGPGTGKTYSLIRRLDYLVSNGIDADDIVVISFTNAVVDEVKIRLNQLANENGNNALRNTFVRTYHSLAWWLLKMGNEYIDAEGFDWEEINTSFSQLNYEDGLIKAAKMIEKNPEVVGTWKCLVVDEIQDINNGKAMFVMALVDACKAQGVPILLLGDTCQSIYNYLNDNNTAGLNISADDFYKNVITKLNDYAEFVSYKVNHRQNKVLKDLSAPYREAILDEDLYACNENRIKIGEQIEEIVDTDELKKLIEDTNFKSICIMQRRNIDAKLVSNRLIKAGIPNKYVLHNDKNAYSKLIGFLLGGYNEQAISKDVLSQLMEDEILLRDFNISCNEVWEKFQKCSNTRDTIIPIKKLIRGLTLNNSIFKDMEQVEKTNVFVSNIHRSKGLEYDCVILDSSIFKNKNDLDEDKVLYVALTRPKEKIRKYSPNIYWKLHKKARRDYRFKKIKGQYVLEYVCIENDDSNYKPDVSPENYIFEDSITMDHAQKAIKKMHEQDEIQLVLNNDNIYEITTVKGETIGRMSKYFSDSVLRIYGVNKLPRRLGELYVDGIYTFLGSQDGFLEPFERRLIDYNNSYSQNRIFNYVMFSGPAKAYFEG